MCKVRLWCLANKRRNNSARAKTKPTTAQCHGTKHQLWTIHVQIIGVIIFTVGITLIVVCISIHDANSSSMPDCSSSAKECVSGRASERERVPEITHEISMWLLPLPLLLLLSLSRNFGIDDINRCAVARFWPFAFSIPNYTLKLYDIYSVLALVFFSPSSSLAGRSGSLALWKNITQPSSARFFFG